MTKDVLIMKKPPQKGESSVNCIKGTGIIRAPPEFVFRVVRNRENNSKLDDMLKETRLVDRMSDTTVLVHLLFKAVWPTAPRDFTAISTAGRYDESTLVEAGVSVADPRVPEVKGHVRGNIVCGGYVIEVLPGKPEQCEVTYVSQAELRGNIPTFAVNKVTESQPMCIARLRSLAEEQYSLLKNNALKMREFEESVTLSPIFPQTSTLPLSQSPASTADREEEAATPPEVPPSIGGGGGGGGGGRVGEGREEEGDTLVVTSQNRKESGVQRTRHPLPSSTITEEGEEGEEGERGEGERGSRREVGGGVKMGCS